MKSVGGVNERKNDSFQSLETNSSENKVNQVAGRWRGGDLAKGLLKSRLIRAMVLSGLAVGILFLILSAPPVWMIAATAVGAFVVGILIQLPFKGFQKMSFEVTSVRRLIGKNYDEIIEINGNKIFLGALPNRLISAGENLANEEKVAAVLSVNEPWEREPVGLSLPYTEKDWERLGVTYKGMDVKDHTLLGNEVLNEAADFIDAQLVANKNVYVHCRAGCGRSAMAIAAYLIKYQNYTPSSACETIKKNRTISTILKKKERLESFHTSLQNS